jgi:hypothetical protein
MKSQMHMFADALARQGIAVDAAGMEPLFGTLPAVRLRFDKVALRFVDDVQSALHDAVPSRRTLVFTITAPVRLASKTAAALEDGLRSSLVRKPGRIDFRQSINGNQIRARLLTGSRTAARNVVGFVHNPESDPDVLFRAVQSLLRRVA